jgi:uncharacterized protein YggE
MKRLLFFSLVIFPLAVFAGTGLPDKPYIYVEGQATIENPADEASIHFAVVAHNPDETKANQQVQAKIAKLLKFLDDKKIAKVDVIAENLHAEPEYEREENSSKRGKLIGYIVRRDVGVKVRNVSTLAKLVDDVIDLKDIEFQSVQGGFSKEKEMEDEVWQKALTNARDRAEKTLKPLGMKIDSVFAVSPVSYPNLEDRMVGGAEKVIVTGSNIPTESQYLLAPISVTKSAHMIYLISPAK